jgi:hypothetical protein
MGVCKAEYPPYQEIEPDHHVACHLYSS